jgi:type VI secretion system secreted protein Hcp
MPIQINELVTDAGAGSGSDIYLHVQTKRAGKVKGEVTVGGHTDDIQIRGWTWVEPIADEASASSAIGSTQATGRRTYRNLTVSKRIDSASTALLSALATNDEVKEAKLTMCKAGGKALDYYKLTLKGARVVNIDITVGADGQPTELVSFAFTKVEVEYTPQQRIGIGAGASTFTDEILPP